MPMILDEIEVRVLGSLVEKAITTPEYYPLTLNALVNACNQKSNRDPVVVFDSIVVNDAITSLKADGLVSIVMGGESRVPKYREYFAEAYALSPQEVAVLDVLMLRGPQTLGELRTRTERLYPFDEIGDVEIVLEGLADRPSGALVVKLPRQSGRKESRYAHVLSGEPVFPTEDEEAPLTSSPRVDRVQQLQDEVAALRQQLTELQQQFAEFRQQFE